MNKLAVLLLAAVVAIGCNGRPPSEVSNQAKGWVSRLERAVKTRNKTNISDACTKLKEPQARMSESELRMFAEVCDYCENEQWEEAEKHLRIMAGKSE